MGKGIDASKTVGMLAKQLQEVKDFQAEKEKVRDLKQAPSKSDATGKPEADKPTKNTAGKGRVRKASEPKRWVAPTWKVDESKAKKIDRIFLRMTLDEVGPKHKQELVDEAMEWLVDRYKKYAVS